MRVSDISFFSRIFRSEKSKGFWLLMRADKPIGTYLLLWPTLWGLWVASEGLPNAWVLLVFVLGVFVMRSAGCVINDYADRNVDGMVTRTRNRPLVTGVVSEKEALGLFFSLVLIAFLLVLTLNNTTIFMSFGALLLASMYPFMKRFTYLPQLFLGAAFSWAIPMAFTAVLGHTPWYAWALYLANLIWTVAYDTMYAMVDRDDDLKIGVKSTAILFGNNDKTIIALLQIASLCLLWLVGSQLTLGVTFDVSLVIAGIFFMYQQWLIRGRDRDACFKAFLHNHYVGMVVFFGIALSYL